MHRHLAVRQPRRTQLRGDTRAHRVDGPDDLGGRQFLGADLEQQRRSRRHVHKGRRSGCECGSLGEPQRVAELLPAFRPQRRDFPCQATHPAERTGALGRGDRPTRVQHVEDVRALQHEAVRGHGQACVEHPARLGRELLEEALVRLHVRVVEVVPRHLVLGLAERLAVGDAGRVGDLLEVVDALQRHHDPLDAVGDLHRHRVERHAARLLEVRELGDLQPVQPDLPAQPPGAERGRGPVVLDEPHVVRPHVDAQRLQRTEVELLRVTRIRLEDHLELGVRLQPVRVLAVAGVVGPHRGLHVRHAPRLGTEHPQHGRRVQRSGADLGVEGLHDEAAPIGPVLGQREQRVLHRQHGHESTKWAKPLVKAPGIGGVRHCVTLCATRWSATTSTWGTRMG